MRRAPFLSLLSAASLVLGISFADAQAVQGPEAPPTFELDKKGQRVRIDYKLDVKPISNPQLTFSQFAGKRMLLFYFSAKCPHCQHAAPFVQRLADELGTKGYGSLAIAIKWNTEDDIRGFIRDLGVRMPIMQDDNRTFGDNYGVGTIPVIYLVNEKGEFIRWRSFNEDETPVEVRTAAASWPALKK
ncbi:MAG TPA: TlpA disulfide reductase family protein [Fibrobacteria bacterium]|jgi:peroxiredoxin|nr:TlpA disulfide reductase family protein [Fibrobacteria bacterium]